MNSLWEKLDAIASAVAKPVAAPPTGIAESAPAALAPLHFVPMPIYRRVTTPVVPATQGPSTSAMGPPSSIEPALPAAVSSESPISASAPFIGAPHGSAAPVIYPAQLNEKVAEKIAADEYVDFHDILRLDRKGAGSKPLSEFEWFRAFCLFSSEFLTHYPDAGVDLSLYGLKVMELMKEQNSDWRGYDSSFRMERRKLGLSFRHLRMDLEARARSTGASQSPGSSSVGQPFRGGGDRKPAKTSAPDGFCFAYHDGLRCRKTPCTFNHDCFKCGYPHPAYGCSARTPFRRGTGPGPKREPNASRDRAPRSPPPGKGRGGGPSRK